MKGTFKRNMVEETKKLLIDCIYSGRSHQQAGQFWMAMYHRIGIPSAILGALLGLGSAGTAIFGDKYMAAMLAILSVVASGTMKFLKPDERADEHLIKGAQYISLRNKVRIYHKLETEFLSEKEAMSMLSGFRNEYDTLNLKPPRNVPYFAYKNAKKSIAEGESDYHNDPLWKDLDK